MNPAINDALSRGFGYAATATSTDDRLEQREAIQQALAILQPLSAPDKQVPRAAFGIGVLAHHMAMQVARDSGMAESERLTTAHQFFLKAAHYFEIAAGMPDYQSDSSPTQAQEALERLRALGVLDETPEAKTA